MTDQEPDPPIPDPEPFFDGVGRVIFAWASMEAEMALLLVAVTHAPIAGLFVNGQTYDSFRRHLEALVKMPATMERYDAPRDRLRPDIRPRVDAELKALKDLSELRNRVAHGLWLANPIEDQVDYINFRPRRSSLTMKPHRFTPVELHQLARKIEAVRDRLRLIGHDVDRDMYGRALWPAPGE